MNTTTCKGMMSGAVSTRAQTPLQHFKDGAARNHRVLFHSGLFSKMTVGSPAAVGSARARLHKSSTTSEAALVFTFATEVDYAGGGGGKDGWGGQGGGSGGRRWGWGEGGFEGFDSSDFLKALLVPLVMGGVALGSDGLSEWAAAQLAALQLGVPVEEVVITPEAMVDPTDPWSLPTKNIYTGREAEVYSSFLKALFMEKGYDFDDAMEPYRLNIVGIRNPNATPGQFNDHFVVVYRNEELQWEVAKYTATVDPGLAAIKAGAGGKKGTAIMCPGQYRDCWEVGKHQQKYEALVQRVDSSVRVWRQTGYDWKDPQLERKAAAQADDEGWFAINIHHGEVANSREYWRMQSIYSDMVEHYSAGCQVIATKEDFGHFMGLAKKSLAHGNGRKRFSYTLLGHQIFEHMDGDKKGSLSVTDIGRACKELAGGMPEIQRLLPEI